MTIEQAERLADLLIKKDRLIKELDNHAIYTNENDKCNEAANLIINEIRVLLS